MSAISVVFIIIIPICVLIIIYSYYLYEFCKIYAAKSYLIGKTISLNIGTISLLMSHLEIHNIDDAEIASRLIICLNKSQNFLLEEKTRHPDINTISKIFKEYCNEQHSLWCIEQLDKEFNSIIKDIRDKYQIEVVDGSVVKVVTNESIM